MTPTTATPIGPAVPATAMPYAAVRETHIGVVLFLGDRAYKLKKPVDVGFLDFSNRPAREACCAREVELNRRLAPDVYLGVAHLTDLNGGPGEPLIVMRRMPADRCLTALVRSGAPLRDTIDRLARTIAAFHSRAQRSPVIDAQGRRDALDARWSASFQQARPFCGTVLDAATAAEIERRAHDFLAGRGALFDRRITQGRIIDGHGDLLCDDIFDLPDGPRILDCLEFDDQLRYVDGLDDIAFLAMDLEHLGAGALAEHLLDRYAEFAGDPAPASLRHHYIAYRAFVRAKVACIRSAQGLAAGSEDAGSYATLALEHLRAGTVRMILVGGLPGAGKSTVAGEVADFLGAVLLSTDRIRKETNDRSPLVGVSQPYRQGLYDDDNTERTYAEILRRAADVLAVGESVVLDASWTKARFRTDAALLATRLHAQLTVAQCRAPEAIRRTRMRARLRSRAAGISDANPAIADRMSADADPWPEAVIVDTTRTREHSRRGLIAAIEAGRDLRL